MEGSAATGDYLALEEGQPKRKSFHLHLPSCLSFDCLLVTATLLLLAEGVIFGLWLLGRSSVAPIYTGETITLAEQTWRSQWPSVNETAAVIMAAMLFVLLSPPVLNKIIKDVIEKFDRQVLSVDVHVGDLWCSIFKRTLTLHNLRVDNPNGFSDDTMIKVRRIELKLSFSRLIGSLGKEVEVYYLRASNIDINWECLAKGAGPASGSALGAKDKVISNLETVCQYIAGSTSGTRLPEVPGKTTTFILHEVAIDKIMMNMSKGPILSKGSKHIDDVRIDDFAQSGNPHLSKEELVQFFIDKVLKQANSTASTHITSAKQWILSAAKDVAGEANDVVQNVKEQVQHARERVQTLSEAPRRLFANPTEAPTEAERHASRKDLDRLKKVLVASGLTIEKMCPSKGIMEEEFRTLAYTTATIDMEATHRPFQMLANGKTTATQAAFKQWIES